MAILEKMKTRWESHQLQGFLSYRLENKLEALKMELKKWNEEEFGNVETKKTKLGFNDILDDISGTNVEPKQYHFLGPISYP